MPFFQRLHRKLAEAGVEFNLVYGQEYPGTVPRSVSFQEPWAHQIKNKYLRIGSFRLVWQPCLKQIKNSDLIIVEQANAMLVNHWLMLRRSVRRYPAIAFWGHGSNRQALNPDSILERFKRMTINRVDWWFAYTELSARVVLSTGFPSEYLTVVNNSIDTSGFFNQLSSITDQQIEQACNRLGIHSGDKVCIYCGGLYKNKRLDFLVRAGDAIYSKMPEFRLLVIGDGPERRLIEAASSRPWIRYVGELTGSDRAVYFRMGKALLMPGLVGLVIIDSFVAGIPLFTLKDLPHGPEISYLRPGKNGFAIENNVETYACKVVDFLMDDSKQKIIRNACHKSAGELTIENMVERFSCGIIQCFSAKGLTSFC